MITEGKITLPFSKPDKVSKELETFYNPEMKLNRDIALLVLQAHANNIGRSLQVGLPLAGSGIRAARIIKELPKKVVDKVWLNDLDKESIKTIQKVLTTNKVAKTRYKLSHNDANKFMLDEKGFDYIDIDPFGSPNPFLDTACKRISRNGILAVTATDTAALCGTFPKACKRKYDALNYRCPAMHELGLRILIRKVQLIAAQYEKVAIPILSYAHIHYMRVYFHIQKSRKKADEQLAKHKPLHYNLKTDELSQENHREWELIGPLYTGPIQNKKFLQSCAQHDYLDKLIEEAKIDSVGFYHMPLYAKKLKVSMQPLQVYVDALQGTVSHCDRQGIKTNKSYKDVLKIIKKLHKKK